MKKITRPYLLASYILLCGITLSWVGSWIFPASISNIIPMYPAPRVAVPPITVTADSEFQGQGFNGDGSEGNPYKLIGQNIDATGGSGIWISNTRKWFVIQDSIIYKSDSTSGHAGIRLSNVTNGLIINNTCFNNTGVGIRIEGNSSSISVEGNRLVNNSYGIEIAISENVSVINNNVSNSRADGIRLNGVNGTIILFNNITGSFYDGINLNGARNSSILFNNMSFNAQDGLQVSVSVNTTIAHNNLSKNTLAYDYTGGLTFDGVNETLVWNNSISSNYYGIYFVNTFSSANNTIDGNIITGNINGIQINDGIISNNTISRNNITTNGRGILMNAGSNFTISGNNISINSNDGVLLSPGGYPIGNNTFISNIFKKNSRGVSTPVGTTAIIVTNNTFIYNNFSDNTLNNVYLRNGSDSNWFWGNQFNDSTSPYNSTDNGRWNCWNNTQLGNYWGYYNGTDENDDGIGDTPFPLNGTSGARDFLPIWTDGDDVPPTIIDTGLVENQLFGVSTPAYTLNIYDSNGIDKIWVSYNGTATNYTLISTEGFLPGWDTLGNGTANLTFWVNDTRNFVTSLNVTIRKDVTLPIFSETGLIEDLLIGIVTPAFTLEVNEGNLHLLWFSLDTGVTNVTTGPNGVLNGWESLPDGPVTVWFWANDTVGNVGSYVVHLERDGTPPRFLSIIPVNMTSFVTPPIFNVEIAEEHYSTAWITIGGGAEKYFLPPNGELNASLWASLPNGEINILFHAIDSLGNEAIALIIIVKEAPTDWILPVVIATVLGVAVLVFLRSPRFKTWGAARKTSQL